MMIIPFRVSTAEYSIMICLDDENIERIRQYDPAEAPRRMYAAEKPWRDLRLRDVIITYANEADMDRVREMIASGGGAQEVGQYLTRGFAYRPDRGDHDGPALSVIAKGKGEPS